MPDCGAEECVGMKRGRNNDIIKEQAGECMVIFLKNWKRKVLRYKIYRFCLGLALAVSCTSLTGLLYYYIDSSIP